MKSHLTSPQLKDTDLHQMAPQTVIAWQGRFHIHTMLLRCPIPCPCHGAAPWSPMSQHQCDSSLQRQQQQQTPRMLTAVTASRWALPTRKKKTCWMLTSSPSSNPSKLSWSTLVCLEFAEEKACPCYVTCFMICYITGYMTCYMTCAGHPGIILGFSLNWCQKA